MVRTLRSLILLILPISARTTSATAVLSEDQIAAFDRDGYLVAKGLLNVENLAAAVAAAEASSTKQPGYFSLIQSGAIFGANATAYREAALYSQLPTAVAELMKLNVEPEQHENIRILRDIVMVKHVLDMKTCDWHVDDVGFWPVSYLDEAGINVWIALDDMPYAGNMAVAPGSHRAAWRHDAYAALGQNRSNDIGRTKAEIRQSMLEKENKHYLTCDMHLVNPDMYQKIEETAVHLDNIQKGDVIFASRLLFHRTTAVTPKGLEFYAKQQQQTLKRYSIRYEPGTATIYSGWNVEWSVLHDATNAGLSLDTITARHPEYAFYPQVWPVATNAASMNRVAEHAAEWTARAKQEVYETLFGGEPAANRSTIAQTTQ